MAKRKNVGWNENEIFEYIKNGTSASEIIKSTGISLGTLRDKYVKLTQAEQKFYPVPDLVSPAKNPKVSKNHSILISRANVPDQFVAGDTFDISSTKDSITLKKRK